MDYNLVIYSQKEIFTNIVEEYIEFGVNISHIKDLKETEELDKIDLLILLSDQNNDQTQNINYEINHSKLRSYFNNNIKYKTNKVIHIGGKIFNDDELVMPKPLNLSQIIKEIEQHKNQFAKFMNININGVKYIYDESKNKIQSKELIINLTPVENKIINFILSKDDLSASKNDLLEIVLEYSSATNTCTLETHVQNIKSKVPGFINLQNNIVSVLN